MRRCLFAAVFALCFSVEDFHAQAPASCLYIQPDSMGIDQEHTNPDSVAKDTCSGSSTYRQYYSKRYDVYFKVNAFHLGYGEPDSIIIVHWEDIDTVYEALRDSFESTYNTWGTFYFRKLHPQDTLHVYEGFKIIFDEYHLADGGLFDALNAIATDGLVEIGFNLPQGVPGSIISKKGRTFNYIVSESQLRINIPILNYQTKFNLRLYDLLGNIISDQLIYAKKDVDQQILEVDIHSLPKGFYLCWVEELRVKFSFILH